MSWFDDSPADARGVARERALLDAAELVCEALAERATPRQDLADRLGVQPSEITQRLQGRRNLTLSSISEMLDALDYDLELCKVDRHRQVNVIDMHGEREHLAKAPWIVRTIPAGANGSYRKSADQREGSLAV